jgi:hypothetical protein
MMMQDRNSHTPYVYAVITATANYLANHLAKQHKIPANSKLLTL